MKVFLGGTCNDSTWREDLIELLRGVDYFNPVVDDWTPECQAEEVRQRDACDLCLYVLTPLMTGVYSVAEVVDDSNKRPERTIFCLLTHDCGQAFTDGQVRSLKAVGEMVKRNGGWVLETLGDCARFLNAAAPIMARDSIAERQPLRREKAKR